MPAIRVKIKSLPRFDVPRFTASEMKEIGESARDAEVKRIRRAQKPDGSAAKPLKAPTVRNGKPSGYIILKRKVMGSTKRDWYGVPPKKDRNRAHMLDLLQVVTRRIGGVSAAVIKFPASVVQRAMIRQNLDEMYGLSKDGEKAGSDTAAKNFAKAVKRMQRAAARAGQ